MTVKAPDAQRVRRVRRIILAYPFALMAVALAFNLALGVAPATPALPPKPVLIALTVSGALLLLNHLWLMIATELTRLRFGLQTTPEEWEKAGKVEADAPAKGLREVKRHHDAHTNATENTLYFALLAPIMAVISPTESVASLWFLAFAIGRLGHAWAYLFGKDGPRGIFMSVSLTALLGIASYVALSLMR